MKRPLFTGCATALVTPFDKSGAVDFEALARLLDRQLKGGVSAVVVCATTGECATLTDREFEEIIEFSVKHLCSKLPVIAGTGRNCTAKSLELSLIAQEKGAAGLLMVNPYYNKSSQKGIAEHYEYIADRVALPILLYNVPSRTGISIAAETYKRLSAHPMIYGTKEASGDISLIAHAKALCDKDFVFYSGNDDQVAAISALGGKGVISTIGNIVPDEMSALCRALEGGDTEKGRDMQLALLPLIDAMFCETNPIPIKAAMEMAGICAGYVRRPLTTPLDANYERIKKVLLQYNILH